MSRAIPGRALEIRYLRTGKYPGPYKHPFAAASNVRMKVRKGGREVALVSHRKIAADESDPGFDRYRDNPRRRRASHGGGRSFGIGSFLFGFIAWVALSQIIEPRIGTGTQA